MIFDGLIQRKLASLLRPWLVQEPQWEIKLGFLRTLVVAKNLQFDVTVLNDLVGDNQELRLIFKNVTVDEVSFRLAYWSSPACTIEFHGVNVTLFPEKPAHVGVSKVVEESLDDYLKEQKRKMLSQIDARGSMLHDSMEKIMMTTSSKTRFKSSIINLVLTLCCLHLHDARVRVEFPVSDDNFSWLFCTKELNAESSNRKLVCFFGRIIGLLFLPFREVYLNLEAHGLEIGSEKKDRSSCILSCVNPHTGIRLEDLDPVNFVLSVPEMNFSFSPSKLQMMGAFSNLLYIEFKHVRSGRLLWDIARSKIHNFLVPPGYLLYKVVLAAVLWLRLVREYQYFLELIGYCDDGIHMSDARNFHRPAKLHWKAISEIEKELPAEAIASARQVARYRATLREPLAENVAESPRSSLFKSFWRIIFPLAVIWGLILKIFATILNIAFLRKNSHKVLIGHPDNTSTASDSRRCYHLSFGKISAVISSIDATSPPVRKISNLRSRDVYNDLFSFRLLVKGLSFIYEEDICEQYMSCSVGLLEGTSIPIFGGSESENGYGNVSETLRQSLKQSLDDSKTILWGELACPDSQNWETGSAGIHCSEKLSEEMELIQDRLRIRFKGMKTYHDEKPWALCDIRTFWVYPGLKSPDTGFSTCSLMVGKLNFALGYSSVLSIATLIGQVQHSLYHFDGSGSSLVISHSLRTVQDSRETYGFGRLKSYVKGMKMRLFKLFPDNHVELRAVIVGPRVQISLRNEEILGSTIHVNATDGQNLTINVHEVDFSVWPSVRSEVASDGEHQRPDDLEADFYKLQQPFRSGFSEPNNRRFTSKGLISLSYYLRLGGLNAYFEDSVENQTMQFLLLKPVTAKFTSLRDYVHSFGGSRVASSLSFSGAMTGVTGLFYMDELSVILQVVGRLFSAASITASGYFSSTAQNRQAITEHQRLWTGSASKETIVKINEGAALNVEASYVINASFEVGQFDIILHNSRNGMNKRGLSVIVDVYNITKLGLADFPDHGIWLSLQKTCIDISVGDFNTEIDFNFSGFHTTIFVSKNQFGNADESEVDNSILLSIDCIQEVSLSAFALTLLLDCKVESEASNGTNSATSSNNPYNNLLSDSALAIDSEGFVSDASALAPSPWLLVNSTMDVIFIGTCSVKNGVLGAHLVDKLQLSLSIGGDFQSICFWSQGGHIFVDATVLARFAHIISSYLHCIRTLLYAKYPRRKSMEIVEPGAMASNFGKDNVQEPTEGKGQLAHPVKWELWEVFSVNLSQLSFVLLATDESGLVKEVIGKFDCRMKRWLENRKKFLFQIAYLDILSQNLDAGIGQTEKIIQTPRFSSVGSSYESLWSDSEDSATAALGLENSSVSFRDAISSSTSTSMNSSSAYDTAPPVIEANEGDRNCILQQFSINISAEESHENGEDCISQGWVGNGSVSGLCLTISLSEIQMLMAMLESLSKGSGKEAASDVRGRNWLSIDQEPEKVLEAAVPDGAIVAIQDVHQHMYVTVGTVENKFRLAGTVHYSLTGERALFRVKWQKKRWNFSACFSLMSLYAKSDSGDPLRLNYCASSGFVDISSKDDSACALWKIASCKRESYEDDVDLDPLNRLSNNTYYLLNKKNDCGVAFIDDAFEFVKKPGNLFKFKVLSGLPNPMGHDLVMSESSQLEAHGLELLNGQVISDQAGIVPCITLTIEKVSLTIVHELSDAKDKIPLLQGCINGTDVSIQILTHKTRVMSTITAMLYHFDVHRVIWRELVRPIEICIYFRSRSVMQSQDTGIPNHGMHSRLYIRMKELKMSLTELSLDILLFVIGKLDLAGPFAVKNSAILANCCKVENQSELDLHCHFYDSQSAKVGRRQSALFFLRQLMDQPSDASHATFRLERPAMSSTSSFHVPLSETRIFAWRARIMSLRDPRTSPGPFIVFDISKNAEEGLSIGVSPLLRICNVTGFPVELRIQRPEQIETESASVLLRKGETVDDCMAAFDAINLLGGPKKALLSLGVGNFIFSLRPQMKGDENSSHRSYSVEWSDNLKGGKAVRLSGVIDKLNYQVRKAFSAESWKYSFSTASCSVGYENAHVAKMHFLVQIIGRDVPIMQPNGQRRSKNPSIALQEQKEIFILPTVRVTNLLESDIDVLLTETEMPSTSGLQNINQATISCGLTVDLYANPAIIYFTVTLMMFGSSCKPVNCGQWLKKLNKKKDGVQFLDIDLEFCGGKYFACLRLARGYRGILEAVVFTQYTLRNETDFPLFCGAPNLKPLSRDEAERRGINSPPHGGSFLPPRSAISWFMKSSKLRVKLLDEETSESILDLDALSGLAEISFMKIQGSGFKHLVKLGVSLGPLTTKIPVPSQMVSLVPRYVVSNESDVQIFVRQCFLEDDLEGTVSINSKQRAALVPRIKSGDKRDITVFDKLLRKHRIPDDDASIFMQFRPNETGLGWSGPICVASLGRFFLKFKRSIESPQHQSSLVTRKDETTTELAAVHVVEEASTFVLHFHRPPDIDLPYRIENHLRDASITYYQKDTFEPETLASGHSVHYVWDDLTRSRRLMVKINGINMLRELSLDKLRPWKSFFRARQQRELATDVPTDSRIADRRRTNFVQTNGIDVEKVGYEVYADGPTRVLRICDSDGSCKGDSVFQSYKKYQLRISYFAIHLLEHCKQDLPNDMDQYDRSTYAEIIVGRLENISLDSIFIDQRKYNQIRVQSMNVDEKRVEAPFAAMLRRHLTSSNVSDDCILFAVFVLYPTSSSVTEVKYSSIVLQPIDLNLDEETLMKVVPFWRKSLNTSTRSQQYYFDHFEIHPIKIIASFLPDDTYSSYSTGQEAVRSLLHSVIKIPAIKNLGVELNGVLVTHALVTTRELLLRCARHYSWYAMRAVYIAKGSPLLPPSFASVFDDLASSSLDVFFDPSSSLFNVRGLTLGTFKLVSKCIQSKGFSGTKRYFGDLSKTLRNAGSNILFAAVTEISDSVLKGAESSGLNGMVTGFHHGILKLAMEPSLLGTAFLEGGPDRKIMLDRSPGVDELYIEGYLQAMLDTIYKQEYLRVRVIDNQVILKNLPPNSSLIGEIMDRVKEFLVGKGLLKGDLSTISRPLRRLRGENEWRFGPTVLTLFEHLFVSFAIRMLRKRTDNVLAKLKSNEKWFHKGEVSQSSSTVGATAEEPKGKSIWRWGIGRFVLSALVAYIDGRLCRCIPNPVARRIVSGFLLSFLDNKDNS